MMFNKLSLATTLALAASASAAPACPDTLDGMYKIDDAKTLYYAVVPSEPDMNNGILCARMEAAAEVWLGIGSSTDGMMIGSEAIIGTSDEGVKKYNLNGKSQDQVEMMDEAQQTLMDTSFEQADGMTTMTFTKLLEEEGEIPIMMGENTFIQAHGSSNDLSYHAARGMFKLELGGAPEVMPVDAVPEPIAAEPDATTATATTVAPGATTAATTAAAPDATTTAAPAETEPTTTASGAMSIRAVAVATSLIVPSLVSLFLA